MLIHCLLYVPTLSIVNSIAFANLKEPRDFGFIRMGGTIGWMLAAWPFTFILVDWNKVAATPTHGFIDWLQTVLGAGLSGAELQRGIRWTYVVAGVASLLLAAFSLDAAAHAAKEGGERSPISSRGWKRCGCCAGRLSGCFGW